MGLEVNGPYARDWVYNANASLLSPINRLNNHEKRRPNKLE